MRYVSPLSLVAGFILDTLFLARRVDLFLTNALLSSYLLISALAILLINLIQAGRLRHPLVVRALPLLPVVAQFAFGGLFSAYLSLYSRSASVAVSWIFIVALAALILLNERFAHFYQRFFVQVSLYFTVLFSFLIFFLPVIFHAIGPFMFLGSGALALAIIAVMLALLFRFLPELLVEGRLRRCILAIGSIYLAFNILYFTGAIPPLPLALKDAGVYHSVEREANGTYTLLGEALPWYEKFLNYQPRYHHVPGEPVYVWSAVFAPSGLSTDILHRWQWFDPATGTWKTESTIRFPIYGGGDHGYRGYSEKRAGREGKGRVADITPYGQLLGRISFTIVNAASNPPLIEYSK